MLKPRTYNIADSNIANLGSDLEKKVKAAAADHEHAWDNAGKHVGLEIWRIEKFKVVAWPKNLYGQFFSGDSYIVLHTYKKPGNDALLWDVHFWLGAHTTQDEAGTAAYKTVELDDKLGGAPVQHREVQDYESSLFLSYFHGTIRIMEGGVDTGFTHVKPEDYKPRLFHLKGKKNVRITQVDLTWESLNSGDVFVLDCGLHVYQWNGAHSGGQERMKAATFCRALDDERGGRPQVKVFSEGDGDIDPQFWGVLGQPGQIRSQHEGGSDDVHVEKKLFRLSDASGNLTFNQVPVGRASLDSSDVFVLDAGNEVFAWIGRNSSAGERNKALHFAEQYLHTHGRPPYISISRILEGGENEVFEHALH